MEVEYNIADKSITINGERYSNTFQVPEYQWVMLEKKVRLEIMLFFYNVYKGE
jgi:hypothetical protein